MGKMGPGSPVDCNGLDVSIDYALDTLGLGFPRGCVDQPRRVEANHVATGSQEDPEAEFGSRN